MKLLTLEIKNYRGIIDSEKIYVPDFLLLVGPNNSGKSTILRALDIFFNDADFDPISDYPIEEEAGKKGYRATTKFKLTFSREPGEKLGHQLSSYIVKRKILNKLEEVIVIELEYPRNYKSLLSRKIKINNQYKGASLASNKYYKILELVRKRIIYTYIPAIRLTDADKNNKVIAQLFDFVLGHSKTYRKNHRNYLSSISSQLAAVKKSLKKSLAGFPNVKEIHFDFDKTNLGDLGSRVDMAVTSKSKVPIEQEGTGLQSALVIAIIRYILLSQEKKKGKKMLVGIEEPEIFLHPSAQRALIKAVKHSQALISTHSPIILDELSPKEFTSILRCRVSEKRFIQLSLATDIKLLTELYEESDLTGGEFFFGEKIILVEGPTDRAILKKQLRRRDSFSSTIIQVGGNTKFGKPLKLLRQFDLPIILLVDEDCFTGQNVSTFKQSLIGEGFVASSDWSKLVKNFARNIKRPNGSLSFFKKSQKLTKLAGIFVFPKTLEPNIIEVANVSIITDWLLSCGQDALNLSQNIISELQAIKEDPNLANKVDRLKALVSGDDLKKRFITEQMFDLLIKNNKVPLIFENLTEAVSNLS